MVAFSGVTAAPKSETSAADNAAKAAAALEPPSYRYDAFISYSHDPRQSAITAALQQAVQRFAKPFWKRRAVHLFRDQTNLSANPDLWGTIVEALRNSRFLILIASPKAAESYWVAKEIEWWLSHREADTIIIVLTTGALVWSGHCFSDGVTTALPKIARTAFRAEPLWIKLNGISPDPTTNRWRRDGQFVDAVASIASRLRDIPKEDLYGEDLSRQRQTITVISLLLFLAIGAAIFAETQRRVAVRRADETSAAFIWNRLTFEGRDDPDKPSSIESLWELAGTSSGVRGAFLRQLSQHRHQVDTLAEAPRLIMRSFGLRPDAAYTQQLIRPVLNSMATTINPEELEALAETVKVLDVSPEQARSAITPILGALSLVDSSGPRAAVSQQVATLARAARHLGSRLTAEQRLAAVAAFLSELGQTADPTPALLREFAWAISAVDPTADQASAALAPVVDAIRRIDVSERPAIVSQKLRVLAEAVEVLGPRVDPKHAQSGLTSILGAVHLNMDLIHIERMARAIQIVGPRIAPEQAGALLVYTLNTMRQVVQSGQLGTLARAVRILGSQVEGVQRRAALTDVLAAIGKTTWQFDLQELAQTAQTLGTTPDEARAARALVLNTMLQTTSPVQLRYLAQAVQAFSPTSRQIHAALGTVMDTVRKTTHPYQLHDLVQAVRVLGPTPEQAQTALGSILEATRNTSDPYELKLLAHAIQALGATSDQSQATIDSVLDAIANTNDPSEFEHLIQAARVFGLTPTQAQVTVDQVLAALKKFRDPDDLEALARAIEALGPVYQAKGAATATELARSVLAETDEPDVAEAFAHAIAVILPLDPLRPDPYVANIVELLKWPTTAGPATDALLEVLHERVPGAPRKEAGLDATVEWVARTYPDIDLDGPPTFPASASTGGAW